VYIIMRLWTLIYVETLDFKADQTSYQNFNELTRLMVIEDSIGAVLLILAYFRTLYYLRVSLPRVGTLFLIFWRMGRKVMIFLIVFVVVMIPIAMAFYLLVGTNIKDYSAAHLSLLTTFKMALGGDADTNAFIDDANSGVAPLIAIFWIVISTIMLLNLLIALLNNSYELVMKRSKIEYERQFGMLVYRYQHSFTEGLLAQCFSICPTKKKKKKHSQHRRLTKSDRRSFDQLVQADPVQPPTSYEELASRFELNEDLPDDNEGVLSDFTTETESETESEWTEEEEVDTPEKLYSAIKLFFVDFENRQNAKLDAIRSEVDAKFTDLKNELDELREFMISLDEQVDYF